MKREDIIIITKNVGHLPIYEITKFKNETELIFYSPRLYFMINSRISENSIEKYHNTIKKISEYKFMKYKLSETYKNTVIFIAYKDNPDKITLNSLSNHDSSSLHVIFLDVSEPILMNHINIDNSLSPYIIYPTTELINIRDIDISDIFRNIVLPKICYMLDINIGLNIKSNKI